MINLSLALDIFFIITAFKEKVILVRRLDNSERSGTFHGSLHIFKSFLQISLNLFITILVSKLKQDSFCLFIINRVRFSKLQGQVLFVWTKINDLRLDIVSRYCKYQEFTSSFRIWEKEIKYVHEILCDNYLCYSGIWAFSVLKTSHKMYVVLKFNVWGLHILSFPYFSLIFTDGG